MLFLVFVKSMSFPPSIVIRGSLTNMKFNLYIYICTIAQCTITGLHYCVYCIVSQQVRQAYFSYTLKDDWQFEFIFSEFWGWKEIILAHQNLYNHYKVYTEQSMNSLQEEKNWLQVTIMISSIQRRIRSSVHPAYFNFFSEHLNHTDRTSKFMYYSTSLNLIEMTEVASNVSRMSSYFLAIIKNLGIERFVDK